MSLPDRLLDLVGRKLRIRDPWKIRKHLKLLNAGTMRENFRFGLTVFWFGSDPFDADPQNSIKKNQNI